MTRARNSSIQSLRGLAALLVVFYHARNVVGRFGTGNAFDHLAQFGSVGVDVFFIVSGFIMFYIRDNYMPGGQPRPGLFLYKRVLRVIPPYWLYTALVIVLTLILPQLFRGETPSLLHSLLLIPDDKPYYLMVGWTLSYEIYFYTLFAITLLLTRTAQQQLGLLTAFFLPCIALGLVMGFEHPIARFLTTPVHLEFLMGGAFCLFLSGRPLPRLLAPACLIAGIAIYLYVASFPDKIARREMSELIFFLITAPLLFLGFYAATGPLQRGINRLFGLLGDASYSLYLSHWLVLHGAAMVLAKLGLNQDLILFFGASAASCVFAILSYRLVEQTIPNWIDQGLRRLFGRPGRAAT